VVHTVGGDYKDTKMEEKQSWRETNSRGLMS
jgi:hypothetical protein